MSSDLSKHDLSILIEYELGDNIGDNEEAAWYLSKKSVCGTIVTSSTIKKPTIFAVISAKVEVSAFTITQDSLSFDQLPGAVMSLTALVKELSREVCELRGQLAALSENSK